MRSVIALLISIHQQSVAAFESRIEEQTKASMGSFYRLHPQEFLESVIDVSFGENPPKVCGCPHRLSYLHLMTLVLAEERFHHCRYSMRRCTPDCGNYQLRTVAASARWRRSAQKESCLDVSLEAILNLSQH
jgi:hypothetical protein